MRQRADAERLTLLEIDRLPGATYYNKVFPYTIRGEYDAVLPGSGRYILLSEG